MLERSAGRKFFACADGTTRVRRVGGPIAGISLLFLELGGCMTLGSATPPPVADSPSVANSRPLPLRPAAVSNPAPAVVDDISTYAGSAKTAPREKKRERRARNAPQVASAAHVPPQAQTMGKGAPIDPSRLIGMAPGAVRELLGPPLRIESYDLSREWVYASNGCSFRIFFYPNLNTAAFRVLKYGGNDGNGELMDVSDVCIRHILTARKNATG